MAAPRAPDHGLIVGDSSIARAAGALSRALGPGWSVVAAPGMGTGQAPRVVTGRGTGDVVVIAPGADHRVTPSGLARVLAATGRSAPVVLVTPVGGPEHEQSVQAMVRAATDRPGTAVDDWGSIVAGTTGLTAPHGGLTPVGVAAYAREVLRVAAGITAPAGSRP